MSSKVVPIHNTSEQSAKSRTYPVSPGHGICSFDGGCVPRGHNKKRRTFSSHSFSDQCQGGSCLSTFSVPRIFSEKMAARQFPQQVQVPQQVQAAVVNEDAPPAAPVQDVDSEPSPERRLEVFCYSFEHLTLFWFVLTHGADYVCFFGRE